MSEAPWIITVGICPSWDIVCRVSGVTWGEHKQLDSQEIVCAGKALNVSRALGWLKVPSIAAGLWGRSDYEQMLESIKPIGDFINVRFTKVPGRTRQNVSVLDAQTGKEMHLRAESNLAGKGALGQLAADLEELVAEGSIVVFAGSLAGGELLNDCLSVIARVRAAGAKVVVDTSGGALAEVVRLGGVWLIKPNIDAFRELLGKQVANEASAIADAGRVLCEKVQMVLVSRAAKGATLITKDAALQGEAVGQSGKAAGTVGCGDYLLAGLLAGLQMDAGLDRSLEQAIKVATARAYGLTERIGWSEAERQIEVCVNAL